MVSRKWIGMDNNIKEEHKKQLEEITDEISSLVTSYYNVMDNLVADLPKDNPIMDVFLEGSLWDFQLEILNLKKHMMSILVNNYQEDSKYIESVNQEIDNYWNQLYDRTVQYNQVLEYTRLNDDKKGDKQKTRVLFTSYVAGIKYISGIQSIIDQLEINDQLLLSLEEDNDYDKYAVIVKTMKGRSIGYIPKEHNVLCYCLLKGNRNVVGKVVKKRSTNVRVEIEVSVDI